MALHTRWLETLGERGDAVAVIHASSGERLTFRDLATALDDEPEQRQPVVVGASDPGFVVRTLCAWRDAQPLVPFDTAPPDPGILAHLPPGTAHVKATSGSTGMPRLVLFDDSQIAADADNIVATMGLDRRIPNIAAISLAHSYGFSNLVTPLLLHGIPLILAADALPRSLSRALGRLEAGGRAALPAVPAMWKSWFGAGVLDDRVGLAISAGAPLDAGLEHAVFGKTGIKIHNFLGSSECGGIAYDRTMSPRADSAAAGTALEGVGLGLHGDGCLAVTGSAVGSRYWPDSDPALGSGRFVTSDLAEIDNAGRVRLLGRASDVINVAGRKVAPGEIESAILRQPDVEHCVVFGVPSANAERVEEIVACVSCAAAFLPVLKATLRDLPPWQHPRHWWCVPELKPNARGKFSRAEWRLRFQEKR